jgi:hypothetical protein
MSRSKPSKFPRWATDGGTTVEPPSGEKDTGWVPNTKPPARKMNWLQNNAYEWHLWWNALVASLPPLNWHMSNTPQANQLNAIAYDDGGGYWDRLVAVGAPDGADAYIARAVDGAHWLIGDSNPKNFSLNGVASDGSNYVAVGNADGTDAYIVRKAVAGTGAWAEQSNPKNFSLFDVAYDGSALFVAVGNADGTDAYLITSPDGATWTERSNPKNFALTGVAHDGSGLWVAVGVADGTDAYIITSTDGTTWTERSNPKNIDLNAVVWAPHVSLWIAVGERDGVGPTGNPYLITSPDGITWTERATPPYPLGQDYDLKAVATDDTNYIVAVGQSSGLMGATILVSGDGVDWTTAVGLPTAGFNLEAVAFDAVRRRWVAAGAGGQIAHTISAPFTVPTT